MQWKRSQKIPIFHLYYQLNKLIRKYVVQCAVKDLHTYGGGVGWEERWVDLICIIGNKCSCIQPINISLDPVTSTGLIGGQSRTGQLSHLSSQT